MLDVNYVCVLNCGYAHAGVCGGQRRWTLLGPQAFCELPHTGAVCALHHVPFLQIQQTAVSSGLALLHSVLLTPGLE